MQPNTLIHLISEQTMQNLLPLLALRPARVVHICSRDARFEAAARHIEAAAREAGLSAQFQKHALAAAVPDIEPVRQALKQTLSVFPDAVLNLTGGTKLMCIGAYLGASEFPVPVVYCDTDRRQFILLGKHRLGPLPSFADTVRQLTLRVVLAAHGKAPEAWKFERAGPAHLEFGRRAWELRGQCAEAFDQCGFSRAVRGFFQGSKARIPSGKAELRALCQADLTHALPDPIPAPVLEFLGAAAQAGFLDPSGGHGFRVAECPPDQDLRQHIERVAHLLDGSWLELAALDFVSRSPHFLDPHWSVQPRKGSGPTDQVQSFGETDVVCLALPQGRLQVVSCKSSLEKPLEHLESLRERSHGLGGCYAAATLAVLRPRTEQIPQLRRWGRLLGVRILIGGEIAALAQPAEPASAGPEAPAPDTTLPPQVAPRLMPPPSPLS